MQLNLFVPIGAGGEKKAIKVLTIKILMDTDVSSDLIPFLTNNGVQHWEKTLLSPGLTERKRIANVTKT